jgi:hypothetical protein
MVGDRCRLVNPKGYLGRIRGEEIFFLEKFNLGSPCREGKSHLASKELHAEMEETYG